MASHQPKPSLMRNLGLFVGQVWRGATGDSPDAPDAPARQSRREVEQEVRETDDATLVLRRTTVEEIEVHPKEQDAPRPTSDS